MQSDENFEDDEEDDPFAVFHECASEADEEAYRYL